MHSKQKIIFLALIIALFTTFAIVETYALFETNGYANKELEIGKWNIKLNGTDVTQTKTITISDFNYVNGNHTTSNRFAPGSNAYFDIIIDTSLSQVSVMYELNIDNSSILDYPNIDLSIINLDTNEEINGNTYDGIIRLNDTSRTVTLRISLTWNNLLEYDESDTSLIGEELSFSINANFKQYIEE